MAKPYMTSSDLISAVKRKIAFPIAQNTFSEADVLSFLNEELMISQVPSVLQYHEEYFVMTHDVPLVSNQKRYEIPSRCIGMKLRDVFYKDISNNLFEMTRIQSEDRAFYQRNIGSNQSVYTFYLEGNDVVLTPLLIDNPTGSLHFVFYMRPNQLVEETRVATVDSFIRNITIDNTTLIANDTLTIGSVTFTAVSGSPSSNQFQIGVDSATSTSNLIAAINLNGTVGDAELGSSSNIVHIHYDDITQDLSTQNSLAFQIEALQGIHFTDTVPSNITALSEVDFMQTKPGHRIRSYDVVIPDNGVNGPHIYFQLGDVPNTLIIGDYISSAGECIIPGIPPDLHTLLAERAAARILASLGDTAGLQAQEAKIAESERNQGMLLDNRVEGAVLKVAPKHTILRYGKMGNRRRL